MAEKRKNKRRICRAQVRFGKESCEKTAFTSNFSREGFFVRTNRPYPPGTVLRFEFQLPGDTPVSLEGRVMHAKRFPPQFSGIRKSGMGIQIIGEKKKYMDLLISMKIFEK